jgi:hypothetical protein
MTTIYGALGLADSDRVMLSTLGQRVVFDAVNQVLGEHNADMNAAMNVFVQETTSDYKLRYKLPGGGYLQKLGDQARPGAVKPYAGWDVALPLENFAAALAYNRVAYGYMTSQELARHVDTITVQDRNTVRYEMLRALFRLTAVSWTDAIYGALTIEGLANGDAVTYPAVLGADTEATDNHLLSSGYAVAAVSDVNNPYATVANELEEHFGTPASGSNIIAFIPTATVAKTIALTDFVPVMKMGIQPGQDTAIAVGLPSNVPGRIIGKMATSGVWVSEWRWIPATYLLAVHLDAPKPLLQRIDPVSTGLGNGLQLVATDQDFPFTTSEYVHRFGFGVGNRLNGVAMIVSAAAYSVPTGY